MQMQNDAGNIAVYSFGELVREDMRVYGIKRRSLFLAFFYLLIIAGFLAVFIYRLAHVCAKKGKLGKFAARLLRRFNMFVSSCDIAPTSQIGPGLYMPHPLAVVIGEGVVIGRNATIYQSVTLGLRDSSKEGIYPHLGDNVTLYVGAVICGDVKIGDAAVVGANSVVLKDVPANAVAAGIPARILGKEASRP